VPELFERTGRGRYRLQTHAYLDSPRATLDPAVRHGDALLYRADCFEWLSSRAPASLHAVVTDPPYGLIEYSEKEQIKLRNGKGGVWRIPPSFDGHRRSPLPRFTVLDEHDLQMLHVFFRRLAILLVRAVVPGGEHHRRQQPAPRPCGGGRDGRGRPGAAQLAHPSGDDHARR
jgi:hypothetical protein